MDVQQKLPLLSDAIKQMTHFGWPRVRISSSCILTWAENTATISNINVQNLLSLMPNGHRNLCCRLSVRMNLVMRFVRPMTIPSGSRHTPWISMLTGWRDWQTCLL